MQVWGLLDDRVGHARQVEGVVEALGGGRYLELTYGRRLWQPDLLAPATLAHLEPTLRRQLAPPWPDVVVAAGRRTVPLLRALKRRCEPAPFGVYLMRPGSLAGLDLVAVPEHDRPPRHPRIVTTIGAPHPFARRMLDAATHDLPEVARPLKRPFVTVLVGGPARRIRFGQAQVDALAARVDDLVRRLDGSALVTTSRRTPAGLAARLEAALTAPHVVYDAASGEPNPLRAFLGTADRVVVTADSLSMMSEAAATGRPVHVFDLPGTPPKVAHLRGRLVALGHVQPWDDVAVSAVAPLDEAARLAALIRDRLRA